MYDAVRNGDLSEAKALHEKQKEITHTLFEYPMLKNVSRIKEVLTMTGRISHATVRPPLPTLSPEEKRVIQELIKASQLFD
jgi:dihydrodipicolinate synthase/N-acetylneuraminate lyase